MEFITFKMLILTSTAHVTLTKFGTVEDNLHRAVISIGFGGLLGSTPGLLVGMGFGKVCSLPLTFTQTEDGKLSSCSHDVSSRLKKKIVKPCNVLALNIEFLDFPNVNQGGLLNGGSILTLLT